MFAYIRKILILTAVSATLLWGDAFSQISSDKTAQKIQSSLIDADNSFDEEPLLIIAAFKVDGETLSDTTYLYQRGEAYYFPLGYLSSLLSVAIEVDPFGQKASGFLAAPDETFSLNHETRTAQVGELLSNYEEADIIWIDGDAYVKQSKISEWLPVDFSFDARRMELSGAPRIKLPFQLRREREQQAILLNPGGQVTQKLDYPEIKWDHKLLDISTLDNTIGVDASASDGEVATRVQYNGTFAGDIARMEAVGFIGVDLIKNTTSTRLTLSRNDPNGDLLGPLRATSVSIGNVGLPAVPNVRSGAGTGNGVRISNVPFGETANLDTETLRGELPVGWDVTLFYNGALIGFETSGTTGQYEFADLPLNYGRNEFELVFNGPFGQRRVEERVFMIDSTKLAPGQVQYTAGATTGGDSDAVFVSRANIGIARNIVAQAALVSEIGSDTPSAGAVSIGARASLPNAVVQLDHAAPLNGGRAATKLSVKTAFRSISLDFERSWNDAVTTNSQNAPSRISDKLRATGSASVPILGRVPFSLSANRTEDASGLQTLSLDNRLSANIWKSNLTHELSYRDQNGTSSTQGALRLSRSVRRMRVQAEASYDISPSPSFRSISARFNRRIDSRSRLDFGFSHVMDQNFSALNVAYSKDWDKFSAGLTGRFDSRGDGAIGIQLASSFGRYAREGKLIQRREPMAGSGSVVARAFLDSNRNGRFDTDEESVEGVRFEVNGTGRSRASTDSHGLAFIPYLQANNHTDLAVDTASLQDPQWYPASPGYQVLPRRGKVHDIDFPLYLASEIDGTVRLSQNQHLRGVSNVEVEVVDSSGRVVGSTKTSSDGFYIVPKVLPGNYRVRISSEQLRRLGLASDEVAYVTISEDAEFIHGVDFVLSLPESRLIYAEEKNPKQEMHDKEEKSITLSALENTELREKYLLQDRLDESEKSKFGKVDKPLDERPRDLIVNAQSISPKLISPDTVTMNHKMESEGSEHLNSYLEAKKALAKSIKTATFISPGHLREVATKIYLRSLEVWQHTANELWLQAQDSITDKRLVEALIAIRVSAKGGSTAVENMVSELCHLKAIKCAGGG